MSNGQDFGWPNQYQQQGSGQQDPREQWPPQYGHPGSGQRGQGGPWQPQAYDPGQHQQRLGQPPQQPYPPQGQQWPQPGYNQPYPGQLQYAPQPGYPPQPYAPQPGYGPAAPPRKKHRVFMWVFLAVQVLFLIWVITGVASHPAGPSASAQAAQQCANGGWQGLFKSQADCNQHYAVGLNDASNLGKGLGVALIVVFWCVVDFLMGVTYLIVRLARRRA
jgi:hypothetical protein